MAKENRKFKWRLLVKYMACIDLVFIGVAATMAYTSAANTVDKGGFLIYPGDDSELCEDEKTEMMVITKFILLIAIIVVTTLGIMADVMLMDSTELGQNVDMAAAGARLWKIVNLTVLLLHFTDMFVNGPYDFGVATFVWHVCLLFIVTEYIRELDFVVDKVSFDIDKVIVKAKYQQDPAKEAITVVILATK